MSTHANMVKMTVTSVASAGTGTITLNAASSGFQSFGTAFGADATVDILITEGTAWEVARNCTYTHSGTTVTRGTLESSSTGSAVTFTSAAVVSVVATADSGRRWDSAALEHVAGGDADTTMAVGMMYVTPMSAWATADRTYTLPATAAVGSRIGIMVTSGNASYELIIKPGASDTINGGTAAAEWSRLFITGEVVILRCVTADSAWVVEYDGRIPCKVYAKITTNGDGEAANTLVTPTSISAAWTADVNVGGCFATSTSRINLRRAGNWSVGIVYQSLDATSIDKYGSARVYDGSAQLVFVQIVNAIGTNLYISGSVVSWLGAAGAYLEYQFRTEEGGLGITTGGRMTGVEVF